MSGDVVATIKEHGWILGLIGLMLSTLSAFFGGGWAGRGITWTFAFTGRRRLYDLRVRRERLQRLHDSDREYYGWLLTGVLWVLILLGMQLGLEGFISLRPTWTVEQLYVQGVGHTIERFAMGITVYAIALSRLVEDRVLRRHFDRNIASLDRAIAILEAKQAVHQPAAAV
jgi:hypothetical protein